MRIRSDDTFNPNMNTLFGTKANIRYIPNCDDMLLLLIYYIQ